MSAKITTVNSNAAPQAIGPYSQAVRAGDFLYVSGQIPLDPVTQQLVGDDVEAQTRQVFDNIKAIVEAANLHWDDCVKLNISMVDLTGFETVNRVMTEIFQPPYPARACIGVAALPKGALIEVESVFYQCG